MYLLAFTGTFSYTYNIRNYKKLNMKFQNSKFFECLTQGLSTKYLKHHLVTFDLLNNNFFYSQVACSNIYFFALESSLLESFSLESSSLQSSSIESSSSQFFFI